MAPTPQMRDGQLVQRGTEGAGLAPLLTTKLFVPRPRADLVARPHLLARLDAGLAEGRFTLLSAPAGSGKTSLLAAWIANLDRQVAWLTFDDRDQDAHQFLRYLIASLQMIAPDCGKAALAWLDAPPPPPAETVLTGLLNDLTSHLAPCLLVLDDYHLVRATAVHAAVAFLLDHLPPVVHLVVATREDPPLPLPRLRARRQLTEVRAADLRFAPDEAAVLLGTGMGRPLSGEQVGVLVARTEGWAAGLQLAALALRDRPDPATFVTAFAGSHRLVADYLMAEVLDGQAAPLRHFLLTTAVLDRLCAGLCDAVLTSAGAGSAAVVGGSQAILEGLERTNLFLIPLDDDRRWYRYHQLFADALRARLRQEGGPVLVADLHRRASDWFARQGFLPEAIAHALLADAVGQAADLIEQAAPAQFLSTVQVELRGWLAALPEAIVRERPVLALIDAWQLLQAGEPIAAEERVVIAERALPPTPTADRDRNTRGEAAVTRAFLALGRVEPVTAAAVAWVERALVDLAPGNATFRGMAGLCLGSAALLRGEGERAEVALAEAARLGRAAGAPHLAVTASFYLAAAQRALGARRRALATAREALAWSAQYREAVAGRIGALRLLAADLLREEDDLDTAATYASEAVAGFRHWGVPPLLCYSLLALARVRQATGDSDGALAALAEAQHLARGAATGIRATLDACVAQVRLARGELDAALRWVQEPTPTVAGWLGSVILATGYECEHQRIAPAQVWLAHGRATGDPTAISQALELLAAQRRVAQARSLGWLRIKVHALEALAHAALGDNARALSLLREALSIAEPEGYLRLFADEGAPMAMLLRELRVRDVAAPARVEYIEHLLRLIVTSPRSTPAATSVQPTADAHPVTSPGVSGARANSSTVGLIEPLSERELAVLRLIAAGRANAEIARALFVAPSTVKSHINHLFGKLGVGSRTQAIVRARDLGLL